MTLLECKNLSKQYGNQYALKDVTLKIPSGKIIGLLGKNGAGKTTLLKLWNGLLTPSQGEVLFEGQPIGVNSKSAISYLPERTYLDRTMRVCDAVKFFSDFYQNFDSTKAEQLIKELGLDLNTRISKMSKGMQEKLQLTLVMSRKAKLYILDEPLGGIDPATRDFILDTILSNFADGASLVISTHLISDIERILDEVIFLDQGKIMLFESTDKLREREQTSINEIFRQNFSYNSAL